MSKPEFTIGDYVQCTAKCELIWERGERGQKTRRVLHRTLCAFEGWIAGATTRFEGRMSGSYYDPEDPPAFMPSNSHFLWKVTNSLMARPTEVLPGDLELCSQEPKFTPMRKNVAVLNEKDREWLKNESKKWPRDERGRWKAS